MNQHSQSVLPRNSLQPRRPRDSHWCWMLRYSLILFLLFWALPSDAGRIKDRIVAIVNKEVLTLSELREEIKNEEKQVRQNVQGPEQARLLRQLNFKALTRLIERTLQMQLAKERGHEVTDEEFNVAIREVQNREEPIDTSDPQVVKKLKEQLTILKVMQREVQTGVMISERELKQYYDEHTNQFLLPEEYHLSQILIRHRTNEAPEETKKRALQVYAMAQEGADFADLAERRSDGTESIRGGSLGLVRQGELESDLEEVIAGLNPGEVSELVHTENGFHILRVDKRNPPEFIPYPKVKRDIETLLTRQKNEDQFHRWIYELQNKAHIEVKF